MDAQVYFEQFAGDSWRDDDLPDMDLGEPPVETEEEAAVNEMAAAYDDLIDHLQGALYAADDCGFLTGIDSIRSKIAGILNELTASFYAPEYDDSAQSRGRGG